MSDKERKPFGQAGGLPAKERAKQKSQGDRAKERAVRNVLRDERRKRRS